MISIRTRRVTGPLPGLVLAFCLAPGTVAAQATDPFETARHRSGPLAVSPSLSVVDLGLDTNVFNEVADPKTDFTTIVRPTADVWLRGGRLRIAARAQLSYNHFQQYASERYFGTDDRLRFEVRGPRVTPFATVSFLSTRDRITAEVDARVRRTEWTGGGGADIAFGGRLTARLLGNHFETSYNQTTGVGSFALALDRAENLASAALRYRLTPLTTLVAELAGQANRFVHSTDRDADTLTVLPGVEFNQLALISGTGFVGYRRFDFINPQLKDFRGMVGSIDLAYILRGSTRFGFTGDRNVEYSFDLLQPYFVSSGYGLRVTQQITERWNAMGYVSRRTLEYRAALPLAAVQPRTDHVTYLNGSVGARISARTRTEFTALYQRRSSLQIRREFDGLRIGGALRYEF